MNKLSSENRIKIKNKNSSGNILKSPIDKGENLSYNRDKNPNKIKTILDNKNNKSNSTSKSSIKEIIESNSTIKYNNLKDKTHSTNLISNNFPFIDNTNDINLASVTEIVNSTHESYNTSLENIDLSSYRQLSRKMSLDKVLNHNFSRQKSNLISIDENQLVNVELDNINDINNMNPTHRTTTSR